MRNSRALWTSVLALSIVSLILISVAGLIADETNNTPAPDFLRSQSNAMGLRQAAEAIGELANNNVVSAALFGALSSIITLSLIYIFKIPEIRRMSIQILAAAYYENFLHSVVQRVYIKSGDTEKRVIIILPGFAFVENKDIYWNSFQSFAQRHGFRLSQETTNADFGRNILTVLRNDDTPVPIFLDMPTTLTSLKKIIELEEHSPVGTVSSRERIKTRFYSLRDDFVKELKGYMRENDWGNVQFVEGRSLKQFEQEMIGIIAELDEK